MKNSILTRSIRLALALPVIAFGISQALIAETLPEIKIDEVPLNRTPQNSFAPIVEKVSPSVVTISVNKNMVVGRRAQEQNPFFDDPTFRRFFGIPEDGDRGNDQGRGANKGRKRPMQVGLGSGVIVSGDGYILTNSHVVEEGDELTVTLQDGKTEYKAKKIGIDPGSDIAVIKIDAKGLKPATFANSDQIKVGDIAIAIGNPFALRQTVTQGIISATGRNETGISEFGNFIQTDASINPGNSGGALVDAEGRLIGINTAIFSRSGGNMGIGFAVPSNQARAAMESLIKYGKVQRGFLGIEMQELDEKLAKEFQAPSGHKILIASIISGGGAEKGGVKAGDVISEINGRKVDSIADFRQTIANMMPGTKVELKIYRNGEEKTLDITLAERPNKGVSLDRTPEKEQDANTPDVLDGVTVSDISSPIRKQFKLPEDLSGAVITEVNPNSPSADAEIKPGDVILEIDGKPVRNADDAVKMSEEVKGKNSVRLRINSNGATRYVVVQENKDK
jgi:serine protease Do